jgi:hypothetical protein
VFILPTSNANEDDDYSFEVELDGETFLFDFRWNERADAWFMSLSLPNGEALAQGIKVTSSLIPLSWYATNPAAPKGRLFLFDSSGSFADPGRFDLAPESRCQLCYYEQSEWQALLAADDPEVIFAALGLAP